jgi:LytR cell envelope-related transcriptional attenuator
MTDFVDLLEGQLVTAHRRRRERRSFLPPRRALAAVGGAALAAAAIVAVVVALAGPKPRPPGSPSQSHVPTAAAQAPSATVGVLNGTTVRGLARAASDRLFRAGYRPGVVSGDPTHLGRTTSEVRYAPGARTAAEGVARRLAITHLAPLDAATRALGGDATVVVLLGSDRAL